MFSFGGDVFSFRPNVFTLAGQVFSEERGEGRAVRRTWRKARAPIRQAQGRFFGDAGMESVGGAGWLVERAVRGWVGSGGGPGLGMARGLAMMSMMAMQSVRAVLAVQAMLAEMAVVARCGWRGLGFSSSPGSL